MSARISVLYGDIMSALLHTRVRNSRVKAGKAHPELYRHSRLACRLVPLGHRKECDGGIRVKVMFCSPLCIPSVFFFQYLVLEKANILEHKQRDRADHRAMRIPLPILVQGPRAKVVLDAGQLCHTLRRSTILPRELGNGRKDGQVRNKFEK